MPDEITADYVERVLNEINRVDAELTRDILRRPVDEDAVELPQADQQVLESIYAEPILTINQQILVALLRSEEEREDVLPPDAYGQLRTQVEAYVGMSGDCIVGRTVTDFSETDAEADTGDSDLAFDFLFRDPGASVIGWRLSRSISADVTPGSDEEDELRDLTIDDLSTEAPEVCG